MGQGTVTNATDTTNRDINNTQEITRDQTTGMLDGSVTIDHRLLTEDGRKEIIQDHKDFANAVKDTVAIVEGIIESRDFIKNYELSTQNMTVDEKNTLDNLLQSFQAESNNNIESVAVYPIGVAVAEGIAGTVALCARTPACVSAVVNLFGAVTAEKILNSGEEKKETHPKGEPSTSGHSATGMPPNGEDDSKVKNTYQSIKDSPNYPRGFREVQNGTTNNTVNNRALLEELRKIEPGKWTKVYKDGLDAAGNRISIHYFRSQSGRVFNVKTKQGWSNAK